MADSELYGRLRDMDRNRQKALEDIARIVQTLVPLLKDHNLHHIAAELGEPLFRLQVAEQELESAIGQDLEGTLGLLLSWPD